MKLIRQSKLHFQEGNSDKIYEVDIAEVGTGQYVVNFRYGRRGAALKEGSKTTSPVDLPQAEKLFNALEAEKRRKGYLTDGVADVPIAKAHIDDAPKATSREEAVTRRINALAAGQNEFKTAWKPSKVIWMAGQLKLKETVPALLRLIERAGGQKGDEQQRYAAIWALGRCAGTAHDAQVAQTIQVYYANLAHTYSDKVRRVAGEALLHLLTGPERTAHFAQLHADMYDDLQPILAAGDQPGLTTWLNDNVLIPDQPVSALLEALYSLSVDNTSIRQPLVALLREIPLRPGFFRPVRHILKMAELRDDYEVQGLLAYRFEKTPAYYSKPLRDYYSDDDENSDPPRYVGVVGGRIKVKAELKKYDSRLAYSNATRAFLRRRLQKTLFNLGTANDVDYVRLATAMLLGYDKATDYKAAFVQQETRWEEMPGKRNRQQVYYERHFPTYANARLLNQILFGNSNRLQEVWDGTWAEKELRPVTDGRAAVVAKSPGGGLFNSLINRVAELLGTQPSATRTPGPTIENATGPVREELFPQLWDALPRAYVQLLLRAKVDEIHAFAYRNLLNHPDYAAIEARIDPPMVKQLLQSPYEIPARWGVQLIQQRMTDRPDTSLITMLLQSPVADVRALGLALTEQYADNTLTDPAFVLQMALSEYENLRAGIHSLLKNRPLTTTQQQALVGRTVAQLHLLTTDDELTNQSVRNVTDLLLAYASAGFANISEIILLDLVRIPVRAINELVVQILIANATMPSSLLFAKLLANPFETVRTLAGQLSATPVHQVVFDGDYRLALLPELVLVLTHKETGEGVHEAASTYIRTYLTDVLPMLPMAEVLRLIYANYRPAQETGLLALSLTAKQTNLTIRQVIALGNHELLAARQWAVQFFNNNVPRIWYERDEAIRLLDAEWDDTRQGAMQFFRDQFTADDWSPTTLIAIADSVRPDIQTFGRELIGRFFTDENGPDYLMKLSQHPGESVQLFATNYLQRYATNQPERLRELAFYFRTVLMRACRGRIAKDRVLAFLQQEGLKSEANARFVAKLLTEVSATSAIGDKATCIQILYRLQTIYPAVAVPFVRQEIVGVSEG